MNRSPSVDAPNDALTEARALLQEPSRDTKRKILIAVNTLMGSVVLLHTILQLVTKGHLPDPRRDPIILPLMIFVHFGSAAYNGLRLRGWAGGSTRWDAITAWLSVLTLQIVSLAIVHANLNTATSLLLDQTLSILTIVLTGVILGRGAAFVWFLINAASFILAMKSRGLGFEYYLMTGDEVARLKALAVSDPAAYAARMATAAHEKLVPLPILLYGIISLFFSMVAFFATFFETGMIGKVLKTIPNALDKIELAAQERQRLKEDNVRMGAELDVARRIQALLLPKDEELRRCKGLDVAARMLTATEVGGDLYDVLPQPDGSTLFAIGDVTNHGLASGLVMLMSQSSLRICLEEAHAGLPKSITYLNATLCKNVRERMADSRSLSLALLHYQDGLVRLAGQHESVVLLRKGQAAAEEIETADLGITVGLMDDIEPMVSETSFRFTADDCMLLYTDGVTEAVNPREEQYGIERLKESFARARGKPAQEIVDVLLADLSAFTAGAPLLDDVTLVVVRVRA